MDLCACVNGACEYYESSINTKTLQGSSLGVATPQRTATESEVSPQFSFQLKEDKLAARLAICQVKISTFVSKPEFMCRSNIKLLYANYIHFTSLGLYLLMHLSEEDVNYVSKHIAVMCNTKVY